MTAEPRRMPINQLYKRSGITYIRYNAKIEEKANGGNKIGGTRPAFSKKKKQPTYKKNDGSYYYLLTGREHKPGKYAVFLDCDNVVEVKLETV